MEEKENKKYKNYHQSEETMHANLFEYRLPEPQGLTWEDLEHKSIASKILRLHRFPYYVKHTEILFPRPSQPFKEKLEVSDYWRTFNPDITTKNKNNSRKSYLNNNNEEIKDSIPININIPNKYNNVEEIDERFLYSIELNIFRNKKSEVEKRIVKNKQMSSFVENLFFGLDNQLMEKGFRSKNILISEALTLLLKEDCEFIKKNGKNINFTSFVELKENPHDPLHIGTWQDSVNIYKVSKKIIPYNEIFMTTHPELLGIIAARESENDKYNKPAYFGAHIFNKYGIAKALY
jgi:hypothetical protein